MNRWMDERVDGKMSRKMNEWVDGWWMDEGWEDDGRWWGKVEGRWGDGNGGWWRDGVGRTIWKAIFNEIGGKRKPSPDLTFQP